MEVNIGGYLPSRLQYNGFSIYNTDLKAIPK